MSISPESLYRSFGRLMEAVPELAIQPTPPEVLKWLGQLHALVYEVGNIADAAILTTQVSRLQSAAWEYAVHDITAIAFRAFARAELNAPEGLSGSFIPVGSHLEAFSAIAKLLKTATKDVLIVDPHMDETVLTDFGITTPSNVKLRLLTTEKHRYIERLIPAIKKWVESYGDDRPLEVRVAQLEKLHDRVIFIDGINAWTLTQSLKDFANRSPAEIIKADDIADLKSRAYESLWNEASIIGLTIKV